MLKLNTKQTKYNILTQQFTVISKEAIKVSSKYIDVDVIELTSHISNTTKVFNKISKGHYMSTCMAFSIKIV